MGLSALVVDPLSDVRSRFKMLANQHAAFDICVASSTLSEGLERLNHRECDALFVSTRFDALVVSRFISRARASGGGSSAANLIMISRQSTNVPLKQFEMSAPDGYVLEPMVVRDLDGSVKFINGFKEKLAEQRRQAEEQINYRALCARMAVAIDRGKPGLKDLQQLTARLECLTPEQKEEFYSVMTEYFSGLKAPYLEKVKLV